VVFANTRSLLTAAYEERQGRLPASNVLPEGMSKLKLESRLLKEPSGTYSWAVFLRGEFQAQQKVSNFQILRADASVVLEREHSRALDGLGALQFGWRRNVQMPLMPGAYLIRIWIDNATQPYEAWVPFVDEVPEEAPILTSPAPNSHLSTSNPQLAWTHALPNTAGYYWQDVWVSASPADGPDRWISKWSKSIDGAKPAGRCVVGVDGEGVPSLEKGRRYSAFVSSQQTRKFGQITLSRSASAESRFFVD
jgi:hypothetical protein